MKYSVLLSTQEVSSLPFLPLSFNMKMINLYYTLTGQSFSAEKDNLPDSFSLEHKKVSLRSKDTALLGATTPVILTAAGPKTSVSAFLHPASLVSSWLFFPPFSNSFFFFCLFWFRGLFLPNLILLLLSCCKQMSLLHLWLWSNTPCLPSTTSLQMLPLLAKLQRKKKKKKVTGSPSANHSMGRDEGEEKSWALPWWCPKDGCWGSVPHHLYRGEHLHMDASPKLTKYRNTIYELAIKL